MSNENPKPDSVLKHLDAFAGIWKTEGEIKDDNPAVPVGGAIFTSGYKVEVFSFIKWMSVWVASRYIPPRLSDVNLSLEHTRGTISTIKAVAAK